jgi:centractin
MCRLADTCTQMWVEKDEWQENPDIIHTKFA